VEPAAIIHLEGLRGTLLTHRLHGIETPVAGSGKQSIIKRRVRTTAAAEGDGMRRKVEEVGSRRNRRGVASHPDPKETLQRPCQKRPWVLGSVRHGLDKIFCQLQTPTHSGSTRTAAGFGNRALYPPKKKLTWTAASVASSPDHHGRLCGRCRGCDPKKALFWAPPANCVKHLATVHNPGRRR
jgi:hypothetical protein